MGTENQNGVSEVVPSRTLEPLDLNFEDDEHARINYELKLARKKQIEAATEARELATAIRRGDYYAAEDVRVSIRKFRAELLAVLRHTLPLHVAPKLVGKNQAEIAALLKEEIEKISKRYLDEERKRVKSLLARSDRGRGLKVPARLDIT